MGTLLALACTCRCHLSLPLYLAVLVTVVVVGIWICDRASRDLGVHDHPGIVWDEIAVYLLTMLAAPTGWVCGSPSGWPVPPVRHLEVHSRSAGWTVASAAGSCSTTWSRVIRGGLSAGVGVVAQRANAG